MKLWFEPMSPPPTSAAVHHHHHHHQRNYFYQHHSVVSNRKSDPSGCISNWSAHGLLKRGLRRWGSTGSWVC